MTDLAQRAYDLALANANNIEAALKSLADLHKRVDEISPPNVADNLNPDAPVLEQLRRKVRMAPPGAKPPRSSETPPKMTTADLLVFALMLAQAKADADKAKPETPETFAQGVARIVKEFAKGCTNGPAGQCEDCQDGAISAIVALAARHEIKTN